MFSCRKLFWWSFRTPEPFNFLSIFSHPVYCENGNLSKGLTIRFYLDPFNVIPEDFNGLLRNTWLVFAKCMIDCLPLTVFYFYRCRFLSLHLPWKLISDSVFPPDLHYADTDHKRLQRNHNATISQPYSKTDICEICVEKSLPCT